ncbi:MAG TPA: hypothetical protein VKB34_12115 [Povalibacter sp.]|nr:hypothetical protein [Povalibacter sp.]
MLTLQNGKIVTVAEPAHGGSGSSWRSVPSIRVELAERRPAHPQRKFLSGINSPFVVTLLGGMLAALISQVWQSRASEIAYQRTVLEAALSERRAVANQFAMKFASAIYRAELLKRREIWLREAASYQDKTSGKFPDGRTFDEQRQNYEAIAERYYATETPEGLVSTVLASYSSESTRTRATQLYELLDRFMQVRKMDEMKSLYATINKEYPQLLVSMVDELKSVDRAHSTG